MIDFKKYDEENPKIWALFVKYAIEAKQKGFKSYSANGIFEIIRWNTKESGNDGFKVNNNYRPDYARKMMNKHPEFKGFFQIREIKAIRNK
jgi:hypothetical protein